MKNLRLKKLRILHCLETIGSGGVEQTRLLLAQGLNPAQYEVLQLSNLSHHPEQFQVFLQLPYR
ncbi:MAG: hypothetical protein D3916_06660, partial [Candidatus Electrothrix sp. MAN1_4]|nr:hypothetical protein [Candidatus Electrothrix sp. MAN1_4]